MKLIKIPRNLFQTWEIKELTPEMNLLTSSWKINNPNYAYFLFDDAERKQFIKTTLKNVFTTLIVKLFLAHSKQIYGVIAFYIFMEVFLLTWIHYL